MMTVSEIKDLVKDRGEVSVLVCQDEVMKERKMKKESKITLAGIGSVMIDVAAGTLRPRTHVVGQRLGVGFSFGDARKASAARERRGDIVAQATKYHGQPEYGWRWLDHDGVDAGASF